MNIVVRGPARHPVTRRRFGVPSAIELMVEYSVSVMTTNVELLSEFGHRVLEALQFAKQHVEFAATNGHEA